MSAEIKAKLQVFWKLIKYLIINKISMISKEFLAKLSQNIAVGKMVPGEPSSPHSFGGVSVIMCGDFFQFPPVTCSETDALYFPADPVHCKQDSIIGHLAYEESTTVVILKEQMRVVDEGWQDFLQHLWFSQVQQQHVKMLRMLLLTNPNCIETDFSASPWTNTTLIIPCHAVQQLWNEAALRQHGNNMGCVIFQCQAEDTIKGKPLTLSEHYAIVGQGTGDRSARKRRKQDLLNMVKVSIRIKVMVTQMLK
ncbi:hypothetical protein HD554DRAFT_2040280 [Boletus coccyginus]|nr:hypothetical protein HD554DRAFT_2040280 [Boletus coccyginus]